MVPISEILNKAKDYNGKVNTDLIDKAYRYSERMHEGQVRKSGEPFLVHPVGVADIITDIRLDSASICAALLHDVVEDTAASERDIIEQFGKEIAFLVEGVTKLGKLSFISREERQAESFRKMLLAMSHDIRVLLVKLADRLDNMRSLSYMTLDSQERIARETLEIYAPLSARLGIQWIKDELEDLSFKYIYPDAYTQVSENLRVLAKDADRYVQRVIDELQRLLLKNEIRAEVSGRLKHAFSVFRKMQENQCEFGQVHDIMAFRVVVEKLSDCYTALGVVHSSWIPVPGRFKDYIALPKTNMYQSLHTTVIGPNHKRVEIQIRTREMHRTADMGIAAHWHYKESGVVLREEDITKFTWLRNLMDHQKDVADPDDFLGDIKFDLFSDEVYVFTPKGEIRVFPRGSTPVDFAYAIHSEVGNHCAGARVDGSIVPLRYKLHNGDTVEILTSKRQNPSKEWLTFVCTARAQSRIRNYIRTEERKRSINLGRDLLERQLRKQNVSLARMIKSGEITKVTDNFKCPSSEHLLAQIGFGKLSVAQIISFITAENGDEGTQLPRPSALERAARWVKRSRSTDDIVIDDISDVLIRFAKCCNPVPGDPITGWITRGRGVTIHRRGCARAMQLEPERRIAVAWSSGLKSVYRVGLRVVSADRPGILASLSKEFNDIGININEANCRPYEDGRAVSTFQFAVNDVNKLRSLMRSISKIDGVYDVERL
ncbi:MAG: bifunctional (p)ppGpp synthetase/guanosine-3',5'-bis(diphosphate) 3'-pyrophosphohydrolase [Deltaproteobacteria bacterium]|nr:bifunctional (p)ppGpp synthetase/guanosine-3',5'-bis(diphosphate) 3'-pyrophosphohydrolase [Deltaproteobacteria bacterium]